MVAPLLQTVATLRSREPELAAELQTALDTLSRDVLSVLQEQAGMADELLRAFEQLGIVFDVTHNMPGVESEQQVLHLLVQNLRGTYAEAQIRVAVLERGTGGPCTTNRPVVQDDRADTYKDVTGAALSTWIQEAIAQARRQRRARVVRGGDGDQPPNAPGNEATDHPEALCNRVRTRPSLVFRANPRNSSTP